jgi:hypothetical protein
MANFAVIENTKVVNCITAADQETADAVTGVNQTCIEYVLVEPGDDYIDGKFIKAEKPEPELSWAMDHSESTED